MLQRVQEPFSRPGLGRFRLTQGASPSSSTVNDSSTIDSPSPYLLISPNAFIRMDTAPQPKNSLAVGTVTEALPDTLFRVTLEGTDTVVLAYLAGKMRMNRIRVLVGDRVELTQDPYGGRARITKRL